jgi:large subunit ribosomal protein L28
MPLGVERVARATLNRAKRGLFGGRRIQFGNKISEDGGNKSRRSWKPNVHTVSLYSEALNKKFQLKVTGHALRTIDKAGGLDQYLLHYPKASEESTVAQRLKDQITATLANTRPQITPALADPQPSIQTAST